MSSASISVRGAAAAAALAVTATAFVTAAIAVKMLAVQPLSSGGEEEKESENGSDGAGVRGYGHQLPWKLENERGEVALTVQNEANQLMFKGHAVVRCESVRGSWSWSPLEGRPSSARHFSPSQLHQPPPHPMPPAHR